MTRRRIPARSAAAALGAGLMLMISATGAQQPQQVASAAQGAEAAQNKVAMCVGCHGIAGYKTAFPTVYHVPLIGGQQQAYIVNALKAYRSGERSHPSMRGIAASLTDKDMADLAAYYGAPAK